MITMATIARALQGDNDALDEFEPVQREAVLRTRERLRALPSIVADQAGGKSEEELERLIAVEMHKALIEFGGPTEVN